MGYPPKSKYDSFFSHGDGRNDLITGGNTCGWNPVGSQDF